MIHIRNFGILGVLITLSACATQQEQCIAGAEQDLRVVSALIVDTQATLNRGYALEEYSYSDDVYVPCKGRKGEIRYCWRTELRTDTRPKAVDLGAEHAKLQSLRSKQESLRIQARRGVAACQARFPEPEA